MKAMRSMGCVRFGMYCDGPVAHCAGRATRLVVAAGAIVGVALWGGADWRQFRGPDARGVAASESLPVAWSDGKNGDR